jgi:hypothetical protein
VRLGQAPRSGRTPLWHAAGVLLAILLGLAGALVTLLVLAALRPAHMVVSRRRRMAVRPDAAFAQVDDFHRWQAWSPWASMDPSMTPTIGGAPRGVGATYAWRGNKKVGQGRMEITAADAPRRIEIALEFIQPFPAKNPTTFEFAPDGGGALVTWSMTGRSPYGMRLMGLFINFDKLIGRDFERGLEAMERAAAA